MALFTRYGLTVPAVSGFAPDDIANLRLWLDASDASTITDTGGAVSAWTSKDPSGYVFAQGDGALQPTTGSTTQNSLNTLSFAGDYLQFNSAASVWNFLHNGTQYRIFAVFKMGTVANPDASYALMGTHGGSAAFPGFEVRFDDRSSISRNEMMFTTIGSAAGGVVQNLSPNGYWPPNEHALLTLSAVPAAAVAGRSSFALNSGTAVTGNTSANSASASDARFPLHIGFLGGTITSVIMVGEIAEILVYDRSLTAGEITDLETYLATKWGITLA